MNMIAKQRQYQRGEIVGSVDLAKLFGPLQVPISPRCWYILNVHPHREFKVMKTFRQRNISAWLPLNTSRQSVMRYRRGFEYQSMQNVTSPLITGAILIPDFEANGERWKDIDGVIGIYHMDECFPRLLPKDIEDLRHIEAIGNTPKSKRERLFEVGQLVRVVSGPFRSFCGVVERFDSKRRLTVGVEIFSRITPTELSEDEIESI
jgi:transcriptional antiterminator NusG